jgi:CheY-like chemotaxis protein
LARILIADDSTHAQRMGSTILSEEGFEVTTVSNGQEALQSLDSVLPDLVVADVFMPGRNGYEVCKYIKSDPNFCHILVLLMIGTMEPYDPEEGNKAGADGLITKPLESSNLLATVRELFENAKRFTPVKAKADATVVEKTVEALAEEIVKEFPEKNPDRANENIKTPMEEQSEVPTELSQQAVGILADMLEPSESPEPKPELAIISEPAEASVDFSSDLLEFNPEALIEPESVPLMDPNLQPDTAQHATWIAESATPTPDEEKLFEQSPTNWSDLEKLVEATSTEISSLASLPSPVEPERVQAYGEDEMDALLVQNSANLQVDETPSEGLEVYENLSEASGAPDPELITDSATGGEDSSPVAEPRTDQAEVEATEAETLEPITVAEGKPDEQVIAEIVAAAITKSPEESEAVKFTEDSATSEHATQTPQVDPTVIEKAVREAMEVMLPKIVEDVKNSFKK